jgi:uncharacterized protein (DUF3084 family)
LDRLAASLDERAGRLAANEARVANDLRDVRGEAVRLESARARYEGLDDREASLRNLASELTERGELVTLAERGVAAREARIADAERALERRGRALDVRETELQRYEQALNAREQALDAAEADLDDRRRLFVEPVEPEPTAPA